MKILDKVKKGYNSLTGKTVEEKIVEFGEVYGEILIGVDREIDTLRGQMKQTRDTTDIRLTGLGSRIDDAQQTLAAHSHQLNGIQDRMASLEKRAAELEQTLSGLTKAMTEQTNARRMQHSKLILYAVLISACISVAAAGGMIWMMN
ncbi:hypothetical protein [Paenibacillus lutrae]|uniref:Uncharacterized protein n=1 Tax=Paenibacillus lutrae TaxID=2078573 RepID=A0A7X3FLM6_9BACL|nr:hypothetical protein [Paenibacillus lutrae]MVP01920.1 hypothetical protein [Paenibacillus lutrae]